MVLTCDKLRAYIREKGMTVWAKLKLQFPWTGNTPWQPRLLSLPFIPDRDSWGKSGVSKLSLFGLLARELENFKGMKINKCPAHMKINH